MKCFLVVWLFSSFSLANGGWIGMGGELFKDARNPWFVKNTQNVNYCINVSNSQISVTDEQIQTAFNDALQFWKSEFSRSLSGGPGRFDLGTQTFAKVECSANNIDIRILFGSNLLIPEEIDFLKDPKKFVGVTVRTDYDVKQLRARGFMYFTNDLVENQKQNFLAKAWSHPKILRYALMHELGHVFGLPHMGTGLMSEIFLDQLVKPEYLHFYEELPYESVIQPDPSILICDNFKNSAKQFFSSPAGYDCLEVKQVSFLELDISVRKNKTSPDQLKLGRILLQSPDLDSFTGKPVSFMQLTDEQTVFSAEERQFRLFMVGPLAAEYGAKGRFLPTNPAPPKHVYLRVAPNSMTVLGNQPNGEITNLIQFSSPLGLIYLIPALP